MGILNIDINNINLDDKFDKDDLEIIILVKKKKLHRMKQSSIFLVDNFNNRDMYKFPSNYEENVNPIILKFFFSQEQTHPCLYQ